MSAFGVPATIALGGRVYTFAQRNSLLFNAGILTALPGSVLASEIGTSNFGIPMILPDSAVRIVEASAIIQSPIGERVLQLLAFFAQLQVTNNASSFRTFAQDGVTSMISPAFTWTRRFEMPTLFVHDANQILATNVTAWIFKVFMQLFNSGAANVSVSFNATLTYETWIHVG